MSDDLKLKLVVQAVTAEAKKSLQELAAQERQLGVEAKTTAAASTAGAQAAEAEAVALGSQASAAKKSAAELATLRTAYAEYLAARKAGVETTLLPSVAPSNAGADLSSIYNRLLPDAKKLADLDLIESKLGALNKAGAVDAGTWALLTAKIAENRGALKVVEEGAGGAAGALSHLSFTSGAAAREYGVLAGELARGNYTRLEGSLLTLANRTGLLQTVFSGTGAVIAGAVASLALLATAFAKGEAEDERFNSALIATGNYAGTTLGNLRAMAQSFTSSSVSIGQAKDALGALVSSGQFTEQQIKLIGPAVLEMARLTGESTDQVVKKFEELKKKPAEASRAFNDLYHYLDLATYQRIAELEDQGHAEEAFNLAAAAFEKAQHGRSLEQQKDLGDLQHAWDTVRTAASKAWDAMLGAVGGRAEAVTEKIQRLQKAIELLQGDKGLQAGAPDIYAKRLSELQNRLQDAYKEDIRQRASAPAQGAKAQADTAAVDAADDARKRKAARDTSAGKELDALRAHLQAMAALIRTQDEEERAQLEDQLKNNEIGYAAYYQRLAELRKQELQAEIAPLQVQLRGVGERAGAVSGQPVKDDADREARAGKLNELAAQRIEIEGRIADLKAQQVNADKDAIRQTQNGLAKLDDEIDQTQAHIAELSGDSGADKLAKIRSKAAELIAAARANGRDDYASVVSKGLGLDEAKIKLDELDGQVKRIFSELESRQATIRTGVQTGELTPEAGRGELKNATVDAVAKLKSARADLLKELSTDAAQGLDVSPVLSALDAVQRKIDELSDTPLSKLLRAWQDTTGEMEVASAAWAQRTSDVITQLVTTGKANFRELVVSILSDLARIEIDKTLAQLLGAASGSGGGALGGLLGSAISGISNYFSGGSAVGVASSAFAAGGHVRGPGTSTSDSIPAQLSDGEYVVRAAAVQRVGVGFLDALNNPGSRAIARFAEGGLVGAGRAVTLGRSARGAGEVKVGDINVSVSNDGGALDAQGARQLGAVLRAAVQAELVRQKRDGGLLAETA